jgi:hypothetical protein
MSEPFYGLLESTPAEIAVCESGFKVQAIAASDVEGWEERLETRTRLLLANLRKQNQRRNDCEGNALANGAEAQHQFVTGEFLQYSDTYSYQASERVMSRSSVGRDAGASIESGVIVRTKGIQALGVKPGIPLESAWPYEPYERDVARFETRAKSVEIKDTYVAEHGALPEFNQMLISLAVGAVGHIGTFWPFREVAFEGFRLMDTLPTGGGGHATCIIGGLRFSAVWKLVVWNSHNYGAYLMSERAYDAAQNRRWSPFGGYLIMPDKPVERYHNRIVSGGGYFSPSKGVA